VVSKDVGAKENGANGHVVQKYFLASPKNKLRRRCL